MSWIKRNLYFVIGATVAVISLLAAGWYFYAQLNSNTEHSAKLEEAYTELKRIAALPQNPGNDKIDNIKIAREQEQQVRTVIGKARSFFLPVEPIPQGANVSSEAFAAALRRTVDDLNRGATSSGVTLQPKYDFSFAAQRPLVKFSGPVEPLAAQLGEVKAICDVLFKARINALYNLRRVRVSDDDMRGTQSDYLEVTATTNEFAVLVPYEVTFYSFTPEVATVLTSFANLRNGFIVTTLNIEPGTASTATAAIDPAMQMMGGEGQIGNYRTPYQGAPAVATATTMGRGTPPMVDEKQLKVTMGVLVVKLLPKK